MFQFLVFTHPSQLTESKNRRQIASFIGVHHRNRSAPAAKRKKTLQGSVDESLLKEGSVRGTRRNRKPFHAAVNRDNYGLRDDPFNSFPIDASKSVKLAVDYFLAVYAPTHIFRPQALPKEKGPGAVRSYLNYALQHPIMFESIIALSKCHLTTQSNPKKLLQSDVYYHYGRALSALQDVLSRSERHDLDAVIATILALMSIDFHLSELTAFKAHLDGLRQMVLYRGGIDKVGFQAILKPSIIGYESFWAYVSQAQLTHTDRRPDLSIEVSTRRHYIRQISYPVIPEVYLKDLPQMIRSLALAGRLSIQVVELAHRVNMSIEAINQISSGDDRRGPSNHDASNLQELENVASLLGSANPPLSKIERVLCLAISIQAMDCSMIQRHSPVYFNLALSHARELVSGIYDNMLLDPVESPCFMISLLVMVRPMIESMDLSLYVPENDIRAQLARKMMGKSARTRDWEDMRGVLRQFFYLETCEPRWKACVSKASALWERNAYLDL